jgi:hypothetical protein
MRVTKPPSHARALATLIAAALLAAPGAASAQQPDAKQPDTRLPDAGPDTSIGSLEATAWLFDAPTLPAKTVAELEAQLAQVLGEERSRHILGADALTRHLERRPGAPPTCLKGAQPCGSAAAMTFDVLGISAVIQVKLRSSNGRLEAAYTLRDRRGQDAPTRVASGATPRELALTLVRDIYKATGTADLRSTPPGARVFVDGAEVGVTPVELRLPIGPHDITLQLAEHQPAKQSVEIAGEQATVIDVKLALLTGLLVLEGLPPDATVSVDGGPPQPAQQPLDLPPGDHQLELRAPGHEPRREAVTIAPGQTANRPVTLLRSNPLLRDVSREAILYNRYMFQLSYDHTFETTSFRGALSQEDDVSLELRRFNQDAGDADPQRFIDPNGLRLEFSYFGDNFGLTVLSLAYLTDSRSFPVTLEDLNTGERQTAELTDISRIQIRPFGLNWRFIYKNLVPRVELGSGVTFESVTVRGDQLAIPVSLSRVEPFWTVGLGAQYYLTPRWYVSARYGLLDYFNAGIGAEHSLSFGVGAALPNLFGVEPEPPEQL